jgi:hypothetical protein
MKMSQPDIFDPDKQLTEETVDGLTMPQLMERLSRVSAQAGQSLETSRIVARIPSLRGVLSALDAGRGQTSELKVILDSIQRRASSIGAGIDNLKGTL